MNATPTLQLTVDGTHTVTITLPDKDSAKVLVNRLLVAGARSLDGLSQSDKDNIESMYNNVVADINDD